MNDIDIKDELVAINEALVKIREEIKEVKSLLSPKANGTPKRFGNSDIPVRDEDGNDNIQKYKVPEEQTRPRQPGDFSDRDLYK